MTDIEPLVAVFRMIAEASQTPDAPIVTELEEVEVRHALEQMDTHSLMVLTVIGDGIAEAGRYEYKRREGMLP